MKTIHFNSQQLKPLFIIVILALSFASTIKAKSDRPSIDESQNFTSYHGTIRDFESNQPLVFATISVPGENTSTVTSVEGKFTLKILTESNANSIHISHIGYEPKTVLLTELVKAKNTIYLQPAIISLKEINIYPHDPEFLVRKVMENRGQNYGNEPSMMKGFYRESIKKNRSHVSISEAVVLISKMPYSSIKSDQVKIFKGRKSEDVSKLDTLIFRLKGGPATAMLFDVIKNPSNLLSADVISEYEYKYRNITEIDGIPHFVIEFNQRKGGKYPLYNGKYYISTKSLALTSLEFSLNLDDPVAATNMLIKKKPLGLKINTKKVNYIVNYREQDGTWYFNHARAEMLFSLNWKRRLFNTNYSAIIEMAITDRDNSNVIRFKNTEKFKQSDYLSEEVSLFADPNFWGEHNTIEPDESIQKTIEKLKRKGKF